MGEKEDLPKEQNAAKSGEVDIEHALEDINKDTGEDTLEDSLLRKILDSAPVAIFWKDKDRRFRGANQAFKDAYGFLSDDEFIGKTDEEMAWHPEPDKFMKDELKVLEEGVPTYMDHTKNIIKGEERDIIASKAPIKYHGEIVGLVGTFSDATELYERQRKATKLEVPEDQVIPCLYGKRVLIADGNADSARRAGGFMESVGVLFDRAANGREAVELFASSLPNTYDAIIMEVEMPIMGSFEAAQRIRSLKRDDAKSVPIIAASTSKASVRNHAQESGMDGFIPKPYDRELLLKTLESFFDGKSHN